MELYINDLEYKLLNDYEIKEQAGATAIMEANIKLDDKRVPQPFDTVSFKRETKDFGGDILLNGGITTNVEVRDATLKLLKSGITTYASFAGLTYGDIL